MASRWRGFFVSFEGIDGVGKSTQVARLGATLSAAGHSVDIVKPNDTQVGDLVRSYILQHHVAPVGAWVEALLFTAGRVQLLQERIVPALRRGAVVVADRFADSTLAYQGGGRGLPVETLRSLHRTACDDVWPDLTFLLDLPHSLAVQRQRSQQLPFDRIEAAPPGFHAAVQATFDELAGAEAERIVRVNADRDPLRIAAEIGEIAQSRIAARSRTAVGLP